MKILVTGPESSGKTSLSIELSKRFDFEIVVEYARTYLESNNGTYERQDLLLIAKKTKALYDGLSQANVIFDSFLENIKIWSQYKYGKVDPWIVDNLKPDMFDLVLLLKPNMPWEYDPLRETPDDRDNIFNLFVKELDRLQWHYQIIDALGTERADQAEHFILAHQKNIS